jgi:methyl-accepting chemotaxis protein
VAARSSSSSLAQQLLAQQGFIIMNFIKNLKIGARLGLGFGLVLLLMGAMITLAVTRFAAIGEETSKILDKDWVNAAAAATLNATTRANAQRTLELFFTTDRERLANLHQLIDANKQTVGESIATLERLIYTDEGRALLGKIKVERAAYVTSFSTVDKLLQDGKRDDAVRLLTGETLPAIDTLQEHVKALAAYQHKLVDQSGDKIGHEITSARTLLFGVGLAVLMVAAGFAWWLTHSITSPINAAVKVAETVAAGDLTSRITATRTDETGRLLRALKAMNESLVQVVGTVRRSSDNIATGSSQIAVGNQDLSQRTEEQASNLQQTAASMEQLTSTVKTNADTARSAAQLATSASEAAARGGVVVSQVVGTMEQITTSSKRIGDIIGVIDGIAFQTNILALNAAVEAARAGEQGRGFAVVASEVRNLAHRSAAAAKEIKTLINDSVEKVEIGSRQVGDAGRTMDDIVTQVKRVNDLISDISAATLEQSTGIGQVGDAVMQLDQVTQQNAALVEESAAAAESLKQQAEQLVKAVAVFRLDDSPAREPVAPGRNATERLVAVAARGRSEPKGKGGDDWAQF